MLVLPFYANKGERAPSKRPWAVGSVFIAVLATAVLVFEGYQSPWAPVFTAQGNLKKVPTTLVQHLSGQAKAGSQVFHNAGCIACHTVDGVGGIRGPALDNVLSQMPVWRFDEQVLVGGRGTSYQYMPAFGRILNTTEMDQLIAFFRKVPKAESRSPGPVHVAAPGRPVHVTSRKVNGHTVYSVTSSHNKVRRVTTAKPRH